MSNDSSDAPATGLAARFKAAIDNRREQARLAREAEERRKEQLAQARRKLLNDLAAFGRAIGHFKVTARGEKVAFRFDGRSLAFELEAGSEHVVVISDELTGDNHLFIQEPLNKWVWSHKPRRGPERRVMLFDQGLEALISSALKIQPADPSEAPPPTDPRKRSL